jgi:hypothetical protein
VEGGATSINFFGRFPAFFTVFFAEDAPVDGVHGVGDMMEKVKEGVVEELFFDKDTDVQWVKDDNMSGI